MSQDLFTNLKCTVKYTSINKPLSLFPIGDLHYGAKDRHMNALWSPGYFKRWLKRVASRDDARLIGTGDYIDFASGSNRQRLDRRSLHDSTYFKLAEQAQTDADNLIEELLPFKGKILGLLEGNHYFELPDGRSTTEYLCDVLDCKYLGGTSMVRLAQRYQNNTTYLDIALRHGRGAGQSAGATLNELEKFSRGFLADIYLMGHDHKSAWYPKAHMYNRYTSSGELVTEKREQHFIRTGGLLDSFTVNRESYAVGAQYNPIPIKASEILLGVKLDNGSKNCIKPTVEFRSGT